MFLFDHCFCSLMIAPRGTIKLITDNIKNEPHKVVEGFVSNVWVGAKKFNHCTVFGFSSCVQYMVLFRPFSQVFLLVIFFLSMPRR